MKTKKRLYTMLIWVTAVLCLCSGFTFAACFTDNERGSSKYASPETVLPEDDADEADEEENIEETTEDVVKYDNRDELPEPPDGAVLVSDEWKLYIYEYEGITYHLHGDGRHEGYEMYYTFVNVEAVSEDLVNVNILPEFRGLPVVGVYGTLTSEKLKTLTIPDSVEEFCLECRNCVNLESIVIPDSVTRLGGDAFYGCTSLKYAVIGKNVPLITSTTFVMCYSLEWVYFTNSVKTMSVNAFEMCKNLTDVYFYGTQEEFESIEMVHGDYDTWIDNDYYPNATKHYLLDPVKAGSSPYE